MLQNQFAPTACAVTEQCESRYAQVRALIISVCSVSSCSTFPSFRFGKRHHCRANAPAFLCFGLPSTFGIRPSPRPVFHVTAITHRKRGFADLLRRMLWSILRP